MSDLLITYFCVMPFIGIYVGIFGISEAIRDKKFPMKLFIFVYLPCMTLLWPLLFVIACFGIGSTNSKFS
jgi:hypothetical protein